MLASVYIYRVMVKSVSSCCVCGKRILSNTVTNGLFILSMHIRSYLYPHMNFAFQVNDVMPQRIANTNHATTDMAICKYLQC